MMMRVALLNGDQLKPERWETYARRRQFPAPIGTFRTEDLTDMVDEETQSGT